MNAMSMAALESYLGTFPAFVFNAAGAPADPVILRDKLSQLRDEAQDIQAAAHAEGRDLTAAESRKIDTIYSAFNVAEMELAGAEAGDSAIYAPSLPSRGRRTDHSGPPMRGAGGRAIGESELRPTNLAPGPEGRRYADLFASVRSRSPADDLSAGEFLRLLASNLNDPKLIRAGQTEGTGSDGGFEVPMTMTRAIFDAGLAGDSVMSRCTIYPMSSNSMMLPIVNAFDRSSAVAGITSQWIAEAAEGDLQTGKLTQVSMRAGKLMILCPLSNEVLMDSLSSGQVFADIMGAAFNYDMNQVLIAGDGVAKPQGFINADSLITVAKESGQAGDTLLFPNIVNMWSRLHPACQQNAVWYIATGVVPQLLTMPFDAAATDKTPIFTVGGTASAPTMTLMGRPVVPTEHNPVLGDLGDVLLVDPSRYALAVRGGMQLDRSIHAKFTSDQTVFKLTFRADGRPLWPSVVTPRSGGPTLSWAVTLAARA